jgi:hypothetical protein
LVKKLGLGVVGVVLVCVLVVYTAGRGCYGSHESPGEIEGPVRMAATVKASEDAVRAAATSLRVHRPKQILFGDLHVHTTLSFDAFMFSLPMAGGEGAPPPADACDFARYCSSLDFWSINDHAFSITPRHWEETVESIRQCNEVAGDPSSPDTVAFLGWEWTQVGTKPDDHYGHKNVILAHTDDERIPARPIGSRGLGAAVPPTFGLGIATLLGGSGRLHDMARYFAERGAVTYCEEGVASPDLPRNCVELAKTPAGLFRKLDEWGSDAMVIPHGTTWGFYTPPGSTWDKQLVGDMHDPERQTLIEVYSGHGDSEVYRDFRAVRFDADGTAQCPEPSENYLPSCWQAGEIIRARCLEDGEAEGECEQRAVTARANAAAAGVAVHRTVPGAAPEDFLDAGQCLDCAEPSFNYRPGGSAQYIAAIGNFDGEEPRHFRMGFMASSDNHFARPGTGYKEVHRRGNTESINGPGGAGGFGQLMGIEREAPQSRSRAFELTAPGFDVFETERQTSFLTTGGLIAAHSTGRDRGSIWDAMERREVYGTTGPRILLWFDLLNAPGSRGRAVHMGGEAAMREAPIFQVKTVGSFLQKPGCPEDTHQALSGDRIEHLCKGECYHPSDERRAITRIEIVRIRPQAHAAEPVSTLIEDPWRTYTCDGDPAGCVYTFTDPDFSREGRDTLYYARVFEVPKPGINAGNVRCERDAQGKCIRANLCPSADGSDPDCLASHEPRAWSSPIYVDFGSRS